MDKSSFVPEKIQKALEQGGWTLMYSSFDKDRVQLGDKGLGMQRWMKGDVDIYFYYVGKDHKTKSNEVVLWWNDNDSESFAMRNIISVLKRRQLL